MIIKKHHSKIILLYYKLEDIHQSRNEIFGGELDKNSHGSAGMFYEVIDKNQKNPRYIDGFPYSIGKLKKLMTQSSIHTKTLKKIDKTLIQWFPDIWENNINPLYDPNNQTPTFSFAKKLGIERKEARFIIDRQLAQNLPTFCSITSQPKKAENFLDKNCGLYYLYRHDVNALTKQKGYSQGVLVRSTLSIRYPVPFRSFDPDEDKNDYERKAHGTSRIRCKINLPQYDHGQESIDKLYKYDGYVSEKGTNWWQWLLQMRPRSNDNKNNEDLLLMYTDAPKRVDQYDIAKGIMVTQNQDKGQVPAISSVCIIKINDYSVQKAQLDKFAKFNSENSNLYYYLEPDERDIMRNNLSVIDLSKSDKWDEIDQKAIEVIFEGETKVNLKGLHL